MSQMVCPPLMILAWKLKVNAFSDVGTSYDNCPRRSEPASTFPSGGVWLGRMVSVYFCPVLCWRAKLRAELTFCSCDEIFFSVTSRIRQWCSAVVVINCSPSDVLPLLTVTCQVSPTVTTCHTWKCSPLGWD